MPEHTNKKERKKKKDFLAAALGKSPYLDRAVSSPVGRMSLNVRRDETDLFFLDSLSSYQFNGQRLALLAFYLTTCAPSWPVLKCLLAIAFFFPSKDRGNGWERTPTTPPTAALHRPPLKGARDPGVLQNSLRDSSRTEKLTAWVPELVLTLLLLCKLQVVSHFSFFKVKSFLTLPWKHYFFPPLFCNQILTDTLLLFSEADFKVSW